MYAQLSEEKCPIRIGDKVKTNYAVMGEYKSGTVIGSYKDSRDNIVIMIQHKDGTSGHELLKHLDKIQ